MGWNLTNTKASFKHGSIVLDVHTQPNLSVEIHQNAWKCNWEIAPKEDSVEPATQTPAPEESYSRLNDFIARFPQKFPWPFSYQLDVRVLPSGNDFLLAELWLSVQTSMLECNPQLILTPKDTQGPWTSNPAFLRSADLRSALAIHPLDQSDCEIRTSPSGEFLHLDLFGKFMEKGVIRRGRLLLIASSSSIPDNQIAEFCEQFAASELPLTT